MQSGAIRIQQDIEVYDEIPFLDHVHFYGYV